MAWSASRSSSADVSRPCSLSAMPTLAPSQSGPSGPSSGFVSDGVDAIRDLDRVPRTGHPLDQHRELVAAEAREHLAPAQARRAVASPTSMSTSSPRLWPSVSLTCLNPSRSTKSSASVEPSRARACAGLLGVLGERGAVPEPGERVVQRVMAQLFLELALLGDVVHVEHDRVVPLARRVRQRGRDPSRRPVTVAQRQQVQGLRPSRDGRPEPRSAAPAGPSPRSGRSPRSSRRRRPPARSRAASRPPGSRRASWPSRSTTAITSTACSSSERNCSPRSRNASSASSAAAAFTPSTRATTPKHISPPKRDRVRETGIDQRRRDPDLDRDLSEHHTDDAPREPGPPARGARLPATPRRSRRRTRRRASGPNRSRRSTAVVASVEMPSRTSMRNDVLRIARRSYAIDARFNADDGDEQDDEDPERRVGDESLGAEPPERRPRPTAPSRRSPGARAGVPRGRSATPRSR